MAILSSDTATDAYSDVLQLVQQTKMNMEKVHTYNSAIQNVIQLCIGDLKFNLKSCTQQVNYICFLTQNLVISILFLKGFSLQRFVITGLPFPITCYLKLIMYTMSFRQHTSKQLSSLEDVYGCYFVFQLRPFDNEK